MATKEELLTLLKANLGVTSIARDSYLKSILDSVTSELENDKGLSVTDDSVAEMFAVDYAAWRWRNRGEGEMPRNLRYRLNNLIISQAGESNA